MNHTRPDTKLILDGLKDFQRGTVEYVFRRLYLDDDCARRFLVADEVGLGKTLVARGVIAKTIDHLWDRTDRIDIVYVCSNTDIARQNIQRLNVTGCEDFSLSSRITLLPITVGEMQHRRINFISFTPGTSFDLKDSAGMSLERELLYWLLEKPWSLKHSKATRVLHAYAGVDDFRKRVKSFPSRHTIHRQIQEQFGDQVQTRIDLRERWDAICEAMPRAGYEVPYELGRERNQLIGELRRLLAETCLHWLEPDLIILDEFQRFKHLLQGDADDASEASQLAEHLFSFQQHAEDPDTAARVLLLSATPYKMYTQSQEAAEDDHYEDFQTTLDFLLRDESKRVQFHDHLREYRQELFRLADEGVEELMRVKRHLESSLREVMVRTERLALKADRNGMLVEVPASAVTLKAADITDYLGLQSVAEHLGHADVLEYWKSAPYLLNFMEDYDLKRKLKKAVDGEPDAELARCVRSIGSGLLNREELERYQKLDPANSRLRSLHHDTIGRDAWKLLWIPASFAYYEGSGPFVDPDLQRFTKRLVFSSWRVVPKAIASVLSYEAERCMMQRFRKKVQNTAESRKRRRALLRFTFSKGRPTGMPVLAMLYPCRAFADRFDPLQIGRALKSPGQPVTALTVRDHCTSEMRQLLSAVVERFADQSQPTDERWYWAAPLLLDKEIGCSQVEAWFNQPDLALIWSGDKSSGENEAAEGWARHVDLARKMLQTTETLGSPPSDLYEVLSEVALAAPGAVALRALERILPASGDSDVDIRSYAGPLAHAFLHLFNLPEVMFLLRDRKKETPYWKSVLEYCMAGNLQAVMDEFAHMLVESLGLLGAGRSKIAAEVSKEISDSLTLRTSTAKADVIKTNRRRVCIDDEDAVRIRTRFAMRFGDQESEDSAEPTRADSVRSAFNSPFWPFVLATTSVGQEGLDFHPYCHAVVHWNLPSNPVDLEQREGRVHRYKGHALRKNIASAFSATSNGSASDPWAAMFCAARAGRAEDENDLFPFWIAPHGEAKIERHVPALPHSRELLQKDNLGRSLVLYRMVFGQNRQEDLVDYLASHLPHEKVGSIVDLCRIDLSPPTNFLRGKSS
ncbi:helicase-related protein [Lignipirellula cremea]|uniref:ATP-dependent helicase HepA n=1 Tax=Lignipirellula cremea TaxID=2528010 RepID=A0A518DWQ4_9BACT|nr:helicase-related protein [Lignipirellula cremea]QDU96261.1 ATP-dependent helicase HepA [Lignipirellula cremea]